MSYGVVMCGECYREVHQESDRTWFHCEDQTPMCAGAGRQFPRRPDELRGKWCGADSCGMQPEFDILTRPKVWKRR